MQLTKDNILKIKNLMDNNSVILVTEDTLEYASYSSEGNDENEIIEDFDEDAALHLSTASDSQTFVVGDRFSINGAFIVFEKEDISWSLRFLKETQVKL